MCPILLSRRFRETPVRIDSPIRFSRISFVFREPTQKKWCGGLGDDSRLDSTKFYADKSSIKSPRKIRGGSYGSCGDLSSGRPIILFIDDLANSDKK